MSVEDTINEKIKIGIIGALGEIPEVGGLFALIVEEVWPDPEKQDVWDEIKEKVEALLNEKLSDLVYNDISASLEGLQKNSAEYAEALKDSPDNIQLITEKFSVAKGDFNAQEPHFKAKGYELLLLPLFAQMANMHLSLLREGCIHGKSWGWNDQTVKDRKTELTNTIDKYVKYVDDKYNKGLADKKTSASETLKDTGPYAIFRWTRAFNVVNDFVREMTISVLDYRQMWPYMDISKYPNPLYMLLTREVYSEATPRAYGTIVPRPEPTGKILTSCRIRWGSGGKIDSVTPSYNGVEMPPMGGDWIISDFVLDRSMLDRLTSVVVINGDAVWGLRFRLENPIDQKSIGRDAVEKIYEPPAGHYLSSILASPDPMTTGHVDLVRAIYFGYKLKRTPIFDLPNTPDPKTFSPDIPGVLRSGGFETGSDLTRNRLISVLAHHLKPPTGYFQGLSDYRLVGAGAVLGLLRLTNLATDEQLKDLDEDGLHNAIIIALGSRTQPTRSLGWWQSLTNLELAVLARGLG
jgi:hypothetical protein